METTTTTTPDIKVGTYVRTKSVMSDQDYSGKIGQVADTATDGRLWVKYLNQCYDSQVREFLFQPLEVEALEDQENAPRLRELEAWESRYHFMSKRVADYQRGIEELSTAAIEIAEEHNYCDEYDKVVEEVNSLLASRGNGLVQLARREREYEVDVEISATVYVSTSVTVKASSEEEAHDEAIEGLESYVDVADLFIDDIRYNTPDYEAEATVR